MRHYYIVQVVGYNGMTSDRQCVGNVRQGSDKGTFPHVERCPSLFKQNKRRHLICVFIASFNPYWIGVGTNITLIAACVLVFVNELGVSSAIR